MHAACHEISLRRKLLIIQLLRCNWCERHTRPCSVFGNWPFRFWDGRRCQCSRATKITLRVIVPKENTIVAEHLKKRALSIGIENLQLLVRAGSCTRNCARMTTFLLTGRERDADR
jgi:hypothetical protein